MGNFLSRLGTFLLNRSKRKEDSGLKGCLLSCVITGSLIMILLFVAASGLSNTVTYVTDVAVNTTKSSGDALIDFFGKVFDIPDNISNLIFGDSKEDDKKNKVRQVIDSYSLDSLIEKADDTSFITDDTLKALMLERDSYKRLLQAIQEENSNYKQVTKKIQCKKTYVKEEVIPKKESSDKEDSKSDTRKISTDNSEITVTTKTNEKGEKIKKTKCVEYLWREVTFNSEDLEGQYKLNWQPILLATSQGLLYHYSNYDNKNGNRDVETNSTLENKTTSSTISTKGTSNKKETAEQSSDNESKKKSSKNDKTEKTDSVKDADKELVGNNNEAKVWNFLKAKGLSDLAAAAIMGNLAQESGFNPKSHTDGTRYYGLCQWGLESNGTGRWANLKNKYPGHEYELLYQLKFMWLELTETARARTLPLLTRSKQLEYLSKSNPGAVWIFTYHFEGAVSNEQKYGVQDWEKRYNYAKKYLEAYGGKEGAVTDGKIFNASDVGLNDAGSAYEAPKKYGTYDLKTGLVHLNDEDIEAIISDFKPTFNYEYDIISESKENYTFEECKKMANNGLENDGGDVNTPSGRTEWYTPVPTLVHLSLPYVDITFNGNIPDVYEFNENRWKNLMTGYMEYFEPNFFNELVSAFPNGQDFITTYEYYKSLSNGETPSSVVANNNVSNAEGTYLAMSNVKPSIKIPENAGGMSIPLYLQGDSRWGNIAFGGGDIASSGCSITSLAMVASYLNQKCVYPNHIEDFTGNKYYVPGSGQGWGIFSAVANQWGLTCKQQTANADAIIQALKEGKPVIVSTTGQGTTQTFTKGGHFIVLRGLTSGNKVLVNDPSDNTTTKMHYLKAYSAEFIVSECTINGGTIKPMWIFDKKGSE